MFLSTGSHFSVKCNFMQMCYIEAVMKHCFVVGRMVHLSFPLCAQIPALTLYAETLLERVQSPL